jgi:peroxiredoxin/uncharacterized membrane protein YphA (DoxX/SURF4 family)
MKQLVYFSRIFVGSLFVISGLIKANDPLGFSYKLGEYFEESALGIPFLEPYALYLGMLACLAEIVLGFAVIFGGRMKLATTSLVILTVFFGWLTLYTATCDPNGTYTIMVDGIMEERGVTCVTDCGCFGDAMKGSIGRSLTPWESFYKDAILFVFILPVFLVAVFGKGIVLNTRTEDTFMLPLSLLAIAILSWVFTWYFPIIFTLFIFIGYLLLKRVGTQPDWSIAGFVALVSIVFMWFCYTYLPIRDYRPYAEGKNIHEQMKSAEELGLEPPEYVYDYTMVNQENGEEMVITSKEYMDDKWWERKEWKLDKDRTGAARKIKDGYEAPITDFSFQDANGDEASYEILDAEGPVLVVLNYDVTKASDAMTELSALTDGLLKKGVSVYGLSSSPLDKIEDFRHEYQLAYPYLQGDEKVIKTIVRANPGLLLMKDATVLKKWSAAQLPSQSEVDDILSAH